MQNVDLLRLTRSSIKAGRIGDAIDALDLLEGIAVRDLALKAVIALEHRNTRLALSLVDRCYGIPCSEGGG